MLTGLTTSVVEVKAGGTPSRCVILGEALPSWALQGSFDKKIRNGSSLDPGSEVRRRPTPVLCREDQVVRVGTDLPERRLAR
jgi:hypothetical protein